MSHKRNKSHRQPKQAKKIKISTQSLKLVKEVLTLIGGLAGSILAVYGLVKTFKDDAAGFSWLILVGIGIWLIILWRLFKVRKTTAYSLFIISILVGFVGWIGWQSQVKATEEKVVVLVAQFDGPEETYGLHDQIMEDIYQATQGNDNTIILDGNDVVTSGQGSEYARELGSRAKADLVIWAWYRPTENPNITIHFENLSTAQVDILQKSETYQPEATLSELESFQIQRKLGSETSTLITFLSGILSTKNDDFHSAVERFQQVLTADDISTFVQPSELHYYLCYSYFMLGDYVDAIKECDECLRLDPGFVNAYNNRGLSLMYSGQYSQAILDFTKSIELGSNGSGFYNNRGYAYNLLGQYDKAIADLNLAIELDPNDGVAHNNRGISYMQLQEYDLAIDDFTRAIDIHPNYAKAYANRAVVHANRGEIDLAIKDYGKSIKAKPDYAPAYYNRGLSYMLREQYESAISDFSHAIELESDYSDAYINRGICETELEQFEQAISDFNQAIYLQPEDPLAYLNRGSMYVDLGEIELAVKDFSQAIQLKPDFAQAYGNRGIAYQKLGKAAEAEADFRKYEELTGEKP